MNTQHNTLDIAFDDVTHVDLVARAPGVLWAGVTETRYRTGVVYQFDASHDLAELSARGWANLLGGTR